MFKFQCFFNDKVYLLYCAVLVLVSILSLSLAHLKFCASDWPIVAD